MTQRRVPDRHPAGSLRPRGAAGPGAPQEVAFEMELMEAHAQAVRSGGDWVARAVGVAEARLRADPLDAVALAVKGALLTMVEDDVVPEDRRGVYRRHGIEMMDAALTRTVAAPDEADAVLYVVGVGNAMLPRGLGRDDVARRCFAHLERRADFAAMPAELRLRTLVLHSCIEKAQGFAEAARRRFAAARAIDLPDAAAIVAQWEARGVSAPASIAVQTAPPGPLRIDHIAYLVRDTDRTLAALGFLKAEVVVHRRPLASQGAYISFVASNRGAPRIELVEPFEGNAAMLRRLEREGASSLIYHVGYFAADFDIRYAAMRATGWLPLTLPFEGMMRGCRASHLFHPDFGIVEIMEDAP